MSFLHDPWFIDLPIAFKPIFLNMDLDFDNLHLENCIQNGHWCHNELVILFGHNFDSPVISHGIIDP